MHIILIQVDHRITERPEFEVTRQEQVQLSVALWRHRRQSLFLALTVQHAWSRISWVGGIWPLCNSQELAHF